MHLLVALALVGGKLDDPVPPSAKLADPPAWTARVIPASLRDESPARKPAPQVLPKPPAAPPQLWQLRDRSGRTWTHADPRWLQTYVGRVNAALAPQYTAPVLQYGSPCANGACQR